ncbi:MAG: FKBP-type peptidyl-prolyl cis-trans isomerase FkpA [Bacillariaceae sp.]
MSTDQIKSKTYQITIMLQKAIIMTVLSSLLSSRTARGFSTLASRSANAVVARTSTSTSASRFMSSDDKEGPMPFDDEKMPFYALGTNLAMQVGGQGNFKTLLEEDELDIVLEAFCENLKGTATQDARVVLTKYGEQLNKILQERTNSIVDRVKKDGDEFITNFIDCNEEAVKTDSGLIYCPMTEGEGSQPELSNTVEVHYHGTLTDGTVFDSSVDRGQTISFPLGGVIKGWQEGLAMMKEGGKATLVIPSDLAYGEAGSGDTIPPGATLKFEVELFKVS